MIMKKIEEYTFTWEEVRRALGLKKEIDNLFSSTTYNEVRIILKEE